MNARHPLARGAFELSRRAQHKLLLGASLLALVLSCIPLASAQEKQEKAGASDPPASAKLSKNDQEANSLFRKAFDLTKRADNEADYNKIIDLCDEGLKLEPNQQLTKYGTSLLAWGHNKRGEVYAEQGKDGEALVEFERSVELDNTRWKSVHNRAVSYAQRGEMDKALADFTRTIELKPDYGNAHFNRGEIRLAQGDLDGALEDFDSAIRLMPKDAAALHSRGHVRYLKRNFRGAYDDFTTAIKNKSDFADAYVSRADMFTALADFPQAARDYRAAIRIDPKSARAYRGAAWLMATCSNEKFRDAKLALQSAQRAVELSGEDYRNLDVLAAAYANAGEFEEAIKAQQSAIEMAPPAERDAMTARLELYQGDKPFRDIGDTKTAG